MTTPAGMLASAAGALYGERRWLRPLARDCGIDAANFSRDIRAGRIGAGHPAWAVLLDRISQQQLALNGAADKLERWLASLPAPQRSATVR